MKCSFTELIWLMLVFLEMKSAKNTTQMSFWLCTDYFSDFYSYDFLINTSADILFCLLVLSNLLRLIIFFIPWTSRAILFIFVAFFMITICPVWSLALFSWIWYTVNFIEFRTERRLDWWMMTLISVAKFVSFPRQV